MYVRVCVCVDIITYSLSKGIKNLVLLLFWKIDKAC